MRLGIGQLRQAAEVLQSQGHKTASGQALPTKTPSVIRAEVPARDGMIQAVDAVLLPPGRGPRSTPSRG